MITKFYTSSIEFDTHEKLLRPAITNSWEYSKKNSLSQASSHKINDLSRFFGVVWRFFIHLPHPTPSQKRYPPNANSKVTLAPNGGSENLPPPLGCWWTSGNQQNWERLMVFLSDLWRSEKCLIEEGISCIIPRFWSFFFDDRLDLPPASHHQNDWEDLFFCHQESQPNWNPGWWGRSKW